MDPTGKIVYETSGPYTDQKLEKILTILDEHLGW
jgi:hypothetical protein